MLEQRPLGQIIRVQYVDLLEYCSRTWLQKMNILQIPLFLRVVTTTPQVEAVAAVVDLAPKIQEHCLGNEALQNIQQIDDGHKTRL